MKAKYILLESVTRCLQVTIHIEESLANGEVPKVKLIRKSKSPGRTRASIHSWIIIKESTTL